MKKRTAFGHVEITEYGFTKLRASAHELDAWAERPGERWPCSELKRCKRIFAEFDSRGNLVDIDHPGMDDIQDCEFDAWTSDTLRAAGLTDHPALR